MKKLKNNQNGITLIALIITIIVLLILAGITIGMLMNNDGIIGRASSTKTETEIGEEVEIINFSSMQMASKETIEDKDRLSYDEIEAIVEKNARGLNFELMDDNDGYIVEFTKRKRYYKIYDNGETEEVEIVKDTNTGDITKDKDGNSLDGITKPYEIWNIEDLIVFSAMVNGGYKDTANNINIASNQLSGKTVVLMKNLDFKSNISYNDPTTKVYNKYLGIDEEECETVTLKEALTSEEYNGFVPIGENNPNTNQVNFKGIFDGQGHSIKNIYENNKKNAGLFGAVGPNSQIKNVTVSGKIINSTGPAGGICANTNSNSNISIKNCINYANVDYGTYVGGIVGVTNRKNTIEKCINYGTISNNNDSDNLGVGAGGIVGFANNSNDNPPLVVKNCINYGRVTGKRQAGGIVGFAHYKPYIYNCYNTSEAVISSDGSAGGIVGINYGANGVNAFCNCYNLGTVDGKIAGGIMGSYSWIYGGKCVNCFTTSNITGTTIGGIAGHCGENRTVAANNCYYLKTQAIQKASAIGIISNSTGIDRIDSSLVDSLNTYIESNSDEIDTTGWAKWKLSNGLIELDYSKIWDGENWVSN